jgi:hypothetical protein
MCSVQAYPDPVLGTWRGRWAQISMGILINFAADGGHTARLVEETAVAVIEKVHACEGLLTFYAPFTTECAQCLYVLCTLNHSQTSAGNVNVRAPFERLSGTSKNV